MQPTFRPPFGSSLFAEKIIYKHMDDDDGGDGNDDGGVVDGDDGNLPFGSSLFAEGS